MKPSTAVVQDFVVTRNGYVQQHCASLEAGVDIIERLLADHKGPEGVTFSVKDEKSDLVLASLSNRKITGAVIKQAWVGSHKSQRIDVESFEVDLTEKVLLLDFQTFSQLRDRCGGADDFGSELFAFDGPFELEITLSICDYFGVDLMKMISSEAFCFAKNRLMQRAQPL